MGEWTALRAPAVWAMSSGTALAAYWSYRTGSAWGRCRICTLTHLVRRHGVGRAMADQMVSWCVEQGCIGVDANALPGSRAVKSFFEAGRFTARLLVMHRPLPPA